MQKTKKYFSNFTDFPKNREYFRIFLHRSFPNSHVQVAEDLLAIFTAAVRFDRVSDNDHWVPPIPFGRLSLCRRRPRWRNFPEAAVVFRVPCCRLDVEVCDAESRSKLGRVAGRVQGLKK